MTTTEHVEFKPSWKRAELRVKIKSLAAEARMIRREELRLPGPERTSLYLHRICVVRPEARASQLAYGFLRGRAYKTMEAKVRSPDCTGIPWIMRKVVDLAFRFGPPGETREATASRVRAWMTP